MSIPEKTIYPRTGDKQTVYLKNVVDDPNIEVGDYTMYNDFVGNPWVYPGFCVNSKLAQKRAKYFMGRKAGNRPSALTAS